MQTTPITTRNGHTKMTEIKEGKIRMAVVVVLMVEEDAMFAVIDQDEIISNDLEC